MRGKRLVWAVLAGLLAILWKPALLAQDVPSQVAFEVASIKPASAASRVIPLHTTARGGLQGNASLANVIKVAYDVQPYEKVVPANQDVAHKLEVLYQINALPPPAAVPPTHSEVAAMARQMLTERFGLKLRVGTEVSKAVILRTITPGVLGRGLRPAPEGCTPLPTGAVGSDPKFDDAYRRSCVLTFFGNRIRGTATLDEFVRLLSFGAQQPFLNRTDLEGRFAIDVAVATASWFTVMPTRENDGPALLDALRDQMGLTARTERQPIRLLFVEHVGPLIED